MKIQTLAGRGAGVGGGAGEPPRATAYYYADLERLKRKTAPGDHEADGPYGPDMRDDFTSRALGHDDRELARTEAAGDDDRQHQNELSEYLESNEVINDGAVREVPPLRDRQWSLPEYSTPENRGPEETYSTAGTFPMPEPKEKEPLLAELEAVGRRPLAQLDAASGVRRSRSWYLCCPNVGDDEASRDSSWRYSSLRPVTAPPLPGRNAVIMMATQSSGPPEHAGAAGAACARAERDALVRALAAERQRAAAAARAHDARLAELHGVIAELVRRRAADKHSSAIPEEEVSDECESTTQPAAELDLDADRSRTDQNDTSSMLSPADPPTPQEKADPQELPDDTTDTSTQEILCRVVAASEAVSPAGAGAGLATEAGDCDTCLRLNDRDSELCLSTARCCQTARHAAAGGGGAGSAGGSSCERVYTASPGRCESRQAARVRLRRGAGGDTWSTEGAGAAERVALEVGAQADLREALVAATNDGEALSASVCAWRARCARLEADCRVLQCALARATDTAQRLSCACAVQESSSVSLCCALRAADRALEAYDVLLALAETAAPDADSAQRSAAEAVAGQLLARLEGERAGAARVGEPLLSPGPWLQHDPQCVGEGGWCAEGEARLRAHAARLKADTVALRGLRPPPHLFSYHDSEDEEPAAAAGAVSMAEMEAAVMMQEVLAAREVRAVARAGGAAPAPAAGATHDGKEKEPTKEPTSSACRARRRRERHWLDARAAETDL